jgi:Ner family transcriptional regulator
MITKRKPKESHLVKEWVKYQLGIRGLSFAELARQNGGVRREVPGKVFYMRYPKWERIVAAALDMQPEQLWPERYKDRATKTPRGKSTRKGGSAQ